MKKPYLNLEQRQMIYNDTFSGDLYMVNLRWRQLIKTMYKALITVIPTLIPIVFFKD